jgi:integrase
MKGAHGTGSIRKRSDGRWEGRYTAPNGTQRSVYGRTKQQAIEKLKRKQAEIMTGTYLEASKMTVAAWLDLWLEDYSPQIKAPTKARYEGYARLHFVPAFGNVKLDKLKAAHIQKLWNNLSKKYAPGTIKVLKRVLSSALSTAVRMDLILSNPCSKTTLPKQVPKDMGIIDREQFQAFIAAANETKYADAILLLLQTGLRIAELRGLHWHEIDLDAHTLTVNQQLQYSNKGYTFTEPKNGKPRTIVLMDETVSLLKRHKIQQAEMRLKNLWIDTDMTRDLVFRMPNGNHYSDATLKFPLTRIGEKIGIPDLHAHALRHSYAVAALRSGVEVKTVQNNLGHSTAAMTLDIYAKYTTDMGRVAAQKMDAYFKENS